MSFKIPAPVKEFSPGNPLPVLPSYAFREPKEGKSYIPVAVAWDGTGATLHFNLRGTAAQTFSQMVMIDCDNTQSSSDVTFYFPDSTDTLLVPAGEAGTFPIFTGALEFYLAAPQSIATDQTFFRVLNYRQEPIGNPVSQPHSTAAISGLNVAAGTTAVIPAGTEGTLTGWDIFLGGGPGAAPAQVLFALEDHATSAILSETSVYLPANTNFVGLIVNVNSAAIRFKSGVDLVIAVAAGAITGALSVNARYRQP